MNDEIFFRVKATDDVREFRKEVVRDALRKGFSLKKVLLIEGGLPLLTFVPLLVIDGMSVITVLAALRASLFFFLLHSWVVFWVTLAQVLGVRYEKGAKPDPNAQTLFFSDCLRVESSGIVSEISYSSINSVKETPGIFSVQLQNNLYISYLKKNFLEGDPAAFGAFLRNPGQKPDYFRKITEGEERKVQSEPIFQAGMTPNKDGYVRKRMLENIWVMKNMSALDFWGSLLSSIFSVLPFVLLFTSALFIEMIKDDDSPADTIVSWVMVFMPVLLMTACFIYIRIKMKTNSGFLLKTVLQEYQRFMNTNVVRNPISYSFFDETFEAVQGMERGIYEYSAICRMYRTEWTLILMVGSAISARALSIDKWNLGEDSERLMEFLKEKSGLEWENSPV